MRVLLISANTETIGMPVLPIGLGAVAAATEKAGHDVRTLDLLGVDDPELSIRKTVEEKHRRPEQGKPEIPAEQRERGRLLVPEPLARACCRRWIGVQHLS